MKSSSKLSGAKDKVLFTPGPLTTSATVKQAMLRDLGSRDVAFLEIVRDVRRRLLELAVAPETEFTAVPMQGSGTFGVESVLSSTLPPDGGLLVVVNGAYGRRIAQMAKVLRIDTTTLEFPENQAPDVGRIEQRLVENPGLTAVAMVHCETTTGIINPIDAVGAVGRKLGRRFIVDAMSSFGAMEIDVKSLGIDYLVSSANKCIEGVPGFSLVIGRIADLTATEGWARSLSLDLVAQWKGLESNGQFRFTPPTHSLLAFHQALLELEAEGGVQGRAARYRRNYDVLMEGMQGLGFEAYLPAERQGYIITSFRYPKHPAFQFETFYRRLSDRGYVIYPGKVTDADCFRIGHIGRIFESDIRGLLAAVRDVVSTMNLDLRGTTDSSKEGAI